MEHAKQGGAGVREEEEGGAVDFWEGGREGSEGTASDKR